MKDERKIVKSLVVASLLVISVLTAATAGVSTPHETSAVEQEVNSETDDDLDIDVNDLLDEMNKRDPTDPVDRPDVLDPELTELLSGSEFSDEEVSSSEEILTDPHTIDQHHVEDVHDMGIYGDGVQVSLMDTGFDMAHPDLIGQHAVFEYNETIMDENMSVYDGYPIAFDPVSMVDYAYDGNISQDYPVWEDVAPGLTDNSWYVDTTYENMTYEEDGDIFANFSEKEEYITYEMPDDVGEGEEVRFGLHPDEKLHEWYGERPAVLLTQDDDGDWTNVYVDLMNDREFVEETGAWIDGEDPESEVITRDLNDDGIADVSGGMMYFVSDGDTPIPYSQNMRETMNAIINLYLGYPPGTIENIYGMDAWEAFVGPEFYDTPGDGDMIALMGDFNSFGSYGAHGTWTASAVAGQGVTGVPDEDILIGDESPYPPTPEGSGGLPRGLSPNATIIPMGRFFDYLPEDNPLGIAQMQVPVGYSSVFFTADGYTGDPTITSDSADIASSSFGRTIDENHGGFNFYERLFDYVGTQYTQNTLFINSQGNEGSGFGTVSAPSGGQGVLSVGATGNQMYRVDEWNMYDGGPNPWYGEVTGMTSTGPHSKGSHGPDIMTNGQFGYGADPVNQQLDNIGDFQGNNSWTLWSGTSLSAPNAAGIAALVYEAYEQAHGDAPDSYTLKNIIMQGADDINNSPHKQGPGEANALNSVEIAQGEGLYSEEFQWRPGTNPEMEEHVEHHVNMMEAGEEQTDQMTLHNWADEDIDYEMNAYRQEKVGNTSIELNSGPAGRVPLLAINETGVYELSYNETNDNWDLSEEPMATLDDPDADLFRFGTHTPYENQEQYDYSLAEFYNWEDDDGNGSFGGFSERNRIGSTDANIRALETLEPTIDASPTSDYFTIYDALDRAEDGIIVQMNNDLFEFGEPLVTPFDFTLNIEQYNQVGWDWIEIDEEDASGTLNAGETLEYNITAEVPDDVIKGIYGGKMMIEDTTNDRTMQIPITITVGEYTDLSEPMHFGAAEGEDEHGIYRNDRLFGSWEGDLTGDWRFYTFHLTENIEDRDVVLDIEFDDELSDMSAYLLGGAEHDMLGLGEPLELDVDPFSVPFSPDWNMQDRYGLNTLETHNETDIDRGDRIEFTREEPLESGTYMIAVQSHQISGYEPYQKFNGTLSVTNVRTHRDAAEVVGPDAINFQGEVLDIPAGEDDVNASFRYRLIGEDDWNETEDVVMDDPGDYDITVTDLKEGTYEWKAVTQWNTENVGSIGEPITLQDLGDMVDETYPAEGDVVQGDSITIWIEMTEDFDDELVDANVDLGGWFQQDAEIDDSFAQVDIPVVLSEGEHTYEFYMEDEHGNEHTEEITFTVDNTDPILEITSPEDGVEELVYEGAFTIMGTTEIEAQVWIDGEEVETDENGNFTYETNLTEGQNVFQVVAEDEAGNTAEKTVYGLYLPDYEDIQEIWDALDDYLTEEELDEVLEDYVTDGDLTDALEPYLTEEEINELLDDYVTDENLTEALEPYLTEEEINDVLEDYVTEGDLTGALEPYLTEEEINELLDDYVTDGDLTGALEDYLTEEEINDVLEDYLTEGNLTEALEDYLTEEEINELLDDYVTEGNLTDALADYLTDEEINELLEDYISSENLEETLGDYLTEDEINAVMDELEADFEDDLDEQDDDIGMARNLALVGMILAILAIIIAIVAMQKKKPTQRGEEKEEIAMEEEPGEETDEELFEEETDEELFEEETDEEL